jgi:hypothetical protein
VTGPTLEIPAAWLVDGAVRPDRCVRHGAPAIRRVDLAVRCRPANGVSRFGPGARHARAVRVAGWPLCRRCVRVRVAGISLAAVLFVGGLLALVAGITTGITTGILADRWRPAPLVPVLGGAVAMLGAAPARTWGGRSRLTRVRLTADGATVQVVDAHPDFEARLGPVPPRRHERTGPAGPAGRSRPGRPAAFR